MPDSLQSLWIPPSSGRECLNRSQMASLSISPAESPIFAKIAAALESCSHGRTASLDEA